MQVSWTGWMCCISTWSDVKTLSLLNCLLHFINRLRVNGSHLLSLYLLTALWGYVRLCRNIFHCWWNRNWVSVWAVLNHEPTPIIRVVGCPPQEPSALFPGIPLRLRMCCLKSNSTIFMPLPTLYRYVCAHISSRNSYPSPYVPYIVRDLGLLWSVLGAS